MNDMAQKTAPSASASGVSLAGAMPWLIAIAFLLVMPYIFSANSAITCPIISI